MPIIAVVMPSRILLTLSLCTAAVLALAGPAAALETGINETVNSTKPTAETAAGLHAGWVRLWASWEQAEPTPGHFKPDIIYNMNAGANAAKAKGLKVLMVVQRSPAWASGGKGGTTPPSNPADFGRAMGELAKRVPAVDAWELWNEEDAAAFWGGPQDPKKYAGMVKSAYKAIKAVQPNDIVITGATTGNNYEFIEKLYGFGIKGHFDAVATHTDTACLDKSPDFVYRENGGHIGRYVFSSYREVHRVMAEHGDGDKKVWMTELGWNAQPGAADPNSCSMGRWAGQKPLGVTEADQAAYLTQAYQCLASDDIVSVALWFGLQDIPGSTFAGGYGLFRTNGSARPAADAFRALAGGITPRPCGGYMDSEGPSITINNPTEGSKFKRELGIDAVASDALGVRGVELWIDGKKFRYFGDPHAQMPILWPSREWRVGSTHTLTFKAFDEGGNTSSKSIRVTKVRKLPKATTAASLGVTPVAPGTVQVTGRLTVASAAAASKPRGKVVVLFQQRDAAGKWTTKVKVRKRAAKPVAFTRTLAPGHWRAVLKYGGRKGFKRSSSVPVEFDVA
jgi:hypothetical protein